MRNGCEPPALTWWGDKEALRRYLRDLIIGEIKHLRPGVANFPKAPWADSLDFRHELGIDSLDLLTLASVVTESLQLHRSSIEDLLLVKTTFGEWIEIAEAGLGIFSREMCFRTSGTSGTPKSVRHDILELGREIEEFLPIFQSRKRILSAVPCHHIYGFLFTILLPQRLADHSGFVDIRAVSPPYLENILREGDLLVGFPEYWQAISNVKPTIPAGVIGISSTAACSIETAIALKAYGMDEFIQIYGSTETAGIGWRTDQTKPYQCLSYWHRGSETTPALQKIFQDGSTKSFPLQDELRWESERTFHVGPRLDSAVQVGGINVFPGRVCNIVREHPGVAEAMVRPMRPDEGNRLKAFIVPRDNFRNIEALESDLRSWMRTKLSTSEFPASLMFGPSLPRQANGKTADWIIDSSMSLGDHRQ